MADLRSILGPEEYKILGRTIDTMLAKIKEKQDQQEKAKEAAQSKRERLMSFLHTFHSHEFSKIYMDLEGTITLYSFGLFKRLVFGKEGISLSFPLARETIPFNEGYASREISCGMAGYVKREYCIEKLVKDEEKFKQEILKNFRKRLR